MMNIVLQVGQVLGFVLGGALVALVSARGALALDAATFLVSAGVLLACVLQRQAALSGAEQVSLLTDTVEGFRFVKASPALKRYLGFSVLGSAALITPEGLAVPVAHSLEGGALAAGILTAAVPAGFVVSGIAILRLTPERRIELLLPLSLLALVPLLLSPAVGSLPGLTILWTIAGFGACLNLIASAAYVQACPAEYRSRAYGVAATLLFGTQGATLLLTGWLADAIDARAAIAWTGAVALLLLVINPQLGPFSRRAQGFSATVRSTQG
jgi:hypothetical protein